VRPITDIHCHILPGVDDGPQTMEETLQVIREAWHQGVRCMIATPHYHPGRYVVNSQLVQDRLEEVREACRDKKIPMRILPGQECYWYTGLIDALSAGQALTMNGSSYVLVEFEPDNLYSILQNAVHSLINNGYLPIIAHYERYACLRDRTERLEELRDMGALLQMNFDRLLDKDTLFHRNPWRRLLLQGYVDFLGSDTHGMNFRPLHIHEAAQWLENSVGDDQLWEILEHNPGTLTE